MPRFLFLIMLLLSAHSEAQKPFKAMKDTASFRKNVDRMAKETSSIESEFIQTKNLQVLSEKIKSRGSFSFQKPSNLRWEYNTPYKYVIVMTKDKMLIKDENNKVKKYDISSNKVFKEINDVMISCVNGQILTSRKFRITYLENEQYYKVELVPLSDAMKQTIRQINMYFEKDVKSVARLDMLETGEDFTTIEFTNKKINEPVPAGRFILK